MTVNGATDHLHLVNRIFGGRPSGSIIRTRYDIENFCMSTLGTYGNVGEVRSRYTYQSIIEHLRIWPQGHDHAYSDTVSGEELSHYGGNTDWKGCPDCMQVEQACLGFSYWHRSHQLVSTFVCSIHGTSLVSTYIPKKALHERFWLPMDITFISQQHYSGVTDQAAMLLSTIGTEALVDDSEPFPPQVLRATLLDGLRARYLLTRTGVVKVKECMDDFGNSIPLDTSIYTKVIKQLLCGLSRVDSRLPAQYLIFLVAWLFGDWRSFKERCKWIAAIDNPQGGLNASRFPVMTHSSATWLKRYRETCLMFIAENPRCGRADFLKQEYKTFRWLLRNDKIWLDEQLPLAQAKDMQLELVFL